MSILLDENTTVIVQGITGREGSLRTQFMKEYGTKVVAGVTPGRGGQEVHGIPVYDTMKEAIDKHGLLVEREAAYFLPGKDSERISVILRKRGKSGRSA